MCNINTQMISKENAAKTMKVKANRNICHGLQMKTMDQNDHDQMQFMVNTNKQDM